ncbi:CdaR family protein [Parablautia muri]|uniref:YbbR-like protein n=1 Tax=Parablautia muri TaxID=2320879 RepID=A0A9X5GQH2_9FIRM|nr:hypothetical protein [Parablautia muri]
MKNKLTNNIGLKIASVFFAAMLWLIVTGINNPTIPQTFYDIPVELLHTELITDSGQVYEVLEGTDVISRVTVRAPSSVIKDLKDENIIATADVRELSSLDTISIKLTTNVSNINSITGSNDIVKLKIEDRKSKALTLKATTSGEIESGYMIGDITTDQNLVRISGPQSVIDTVAKASVDVNVTGITSDIVTNGEIKLYDAEDNEVNTSKITQNIKSVGVRVSIWQKTTVPVHFTVGGEVPQGYRIIGDPEVNGGTVEIAGKANALRNISTIEIPAEALDVTDQMEDFVTEVDIRPYLPENVFLVNSEDAFCTVTVHIEAEVIKRMEIREERVRITNLPEGYNATISGLEESFAIQVVGLSQDVNALQANNISGVVDIQQWMQEQGMERPEPGYYTVTVDFGLPENVALREDVTVMLHISEEQEE